MMTMALTPDVRAKLAAHLGNASESFRRLNGLVIADVPGRAGHVPAADADPYMRESDFQDAVESMLTDMGYARRTVANIDRGNAGRWQVHLPRTPGNPIVMDVILFDSGRGRYLEIELKTRRGTPTPAQRALCDRGEAVLCRSLAAVAQAVREWEGAR